LGKCQKPLGKPDFPNGKPKSPKGKLEFPDGKSKSPNGKPTFPFGKPKFPAGKTVSLLSEHCENSTFLRKYPTALSLLGAIDNDRPHRAPMTETAEPDVVMRWLTIALCLPLFLTGFFGLVFPRRYRDALIGMSARIPDKSSIDPILRFLRGRYFLLFLRVFSLFPIGMGVVLLRTIR
jgi:uncharacterized protein YjeT (DUF2065 family)